jgi:hypothetical protein
MRDEKPRLFKPASGRLLLRVELGKGEQAPSTLFGLEGVLVKWTK